MDRDMLKVKRSLLARVLDPFAKQNQSFFKHTRYFGRALFEKSFSDGKI